MHNGEWVGTAGRTLPALAFTAPPWLPDDFDYWGSILCAYFDLGNNACELDRPPYGANMAFRKSVFKKHGGFRIDLGPRPKRQIRNEDTELGRRLIAAGERLRYEPSAIVYHPVPQGRITKEYFYSWWFDYGRARALELTNRPDVWGINRDYLSMLSHLTLRLPLGSVRWILSFNPQKRFRHKCGVWEMAGWIAEMYCHLVDRERKKVVAVQETKRTHITRQINT